MSKCPRLNAAAAAASPSRPSDGVECARFMILSRYRETTRGKLISLAIDRWGAVIMRPPRVRRLQSEVVKEDTHTILQEMLPLAGRSRQPRNVTQSQM